MQVLCTMIRSASSCFSECNGQALDDCGFDAQSLPPQGPQICGGQAHHRLDFAHGTTKSEVTKPEQWTTHSENMTGDWWVCVGKKTDAQSKPHHGDCACFSSGRSSDQHGARPVASGGDQHTGMVCKPTVFIRPLPPSHIFCSQQCRIL